MVKLFTQIRQYTICLGAAASFFILLTSVSSNYWVRQTAPWPIAKKRNLSNETDVVQIEMESYSGLWTICCSDENCKGECRWLFFSSPRDEPQTIEITASVIGFLRKTSISHIVSMLLAFCGSIVLIIRQMCKPRKALCISLVGGMCVVLSGFTNLVGIIIYISTFDDLSKRKPSQIHYDFAFYLAWCAFLLHVIIGVILMRDISKKMAEKRNEVGVRVSNQKKRTSRNSSLEQKSPNLQANTSMRKSSTRKSVHHGFLTDNETIVYDVPFAYQNEENSRKDNALQLVEDLDVVGRCLPNLSPCDGGYDDATQNKTKMKICDMYDDRTIDEKNQKTADCNLRKKELQLRFKQYHRVRPGFCNHEKIFSCGEADWCRSSNRKSEDSTFPRNRHVCHSDKCYCFDFSLPAIAGKGQNLSNKTTHPASFSTEILSKHNACMWLEEDRLISNQFEDFPRGSTPHIDEAQNTQMENHQQKTSCATHNGTLPKENKEIKVSYKKFKQHSLDSNLREYVPRRNHNRNFADKCPHSSFLPSDSLQPLCNEKMDNNKQTTPFRKDLHCSPGGLRKILRGAKKESLKYRRQLAQSLDIGQATNLEQSTMETSKEKADSDSANFFRLNESYKCNTVARKPCPKLLPLKKKLKEQIPMNDMHPWASPSKMQSLNANTGWTKYNTAL
ncbi:uncharacterized protein LOC143445824 [Clavelina lepadiformis]|uniref:uncharacterized protein LOC143445824 n=1 Tax=Clavelina lepadiformis TaxID=159417 RepID=UPI004041165A